MGVTPLVTFLYISFDYLSKKKKIVSSNERFSNLKEISNLQRVGGNKETWTIFLSLSAAKFGVDLSGCYSKCQEGISAMNLKRQDYILGCLIHFLMPDYYVMLKYMHSIQLVMMLLCIVSKTWEPIGCYCGY